MSCACIFDYHSSCSQSFFSFPQRLRFQLFYPLDLMIMALCCSFICIGVFLKQHRGPFVPELEVSVGWWLDIKWILTASLESDPIWRLFAIAAVATQFQRNYGCSCDAGTSEVYVECTLGMNNVDSIPGGGLTTLDQWPVSSPHEVTNPFTFQLTSLGWLKYDIGQKKG